MSISDADVAKVKAMTDRQLAKYIINTLWRYAYFGGS
jgi:hypothetical protein